MPIHNPELARAQELGLDVVSYPNSLFQAARDKQRIVVEAAAKTSIMAAAARCTGWPPTAPRTSWWGPSSPDRPDGADYARSDMLLEGD